ncbi:MAG: glycosyltransferase [Abditibacteriota bacterium]|nr:glycosyltransferase [Abditibacteriota bacterium]
MTIFMATDFRIGRYEGRYYFKSKYFHIARRYFEAFGPIVLFTRIEEADSLPPGIDGTCMLRDAVPIGSLTEVLAGRYRRQIRSAMAGCSLAVCRFPSVPAYAAAAAADRLGIPVFAECMGDAWDASWNHGISGKLLSPYYHLSMKKWVGRADYALYVTAGALQKRYPCPRRSAAVSNVSLPDRDGGDILRSRLSRADTRDLSRPVLLSAGAADNPSKGYDAVIRALPMLQKAGIHATYRIAGPGSGERLAGLAERLGVRDRTELLGELTPEGVAEAMAEADIYLQPSLQEGLPRAVIEAMAMACPCIGSRVGGIPELLPEKYLTRKNDPADICRKVTLLLDRAAMKQAAEDNYRLASGFASGTLDRERGAYFDYVKASVAGNDI